MRLRPRATRRSAFTSETTRSVWLGAARHAPPSAPPRTRTSKRWIKLVNPGRPRRPAPRAASRPHSLAAARPGPRWSSRIAPEPQPHRLLASPHAFRSIRSHARADRDQSPGTVRSGGRRRCGRQTRFLRRRRHPRPRVGSVSRVRATVSTTSSRDWGRGEGGFAARCSGSAPRKRLRSATQRLRSTSAVLGQSRPSPGHGLDGHHDPLGAVAADAYGVAGSRPGRSSAFGQSDTPSSTV